MSLKEKIAKLYCANYCEARVGCPYTEESVQSECDHYYELTVQILDLIEQEVNERGWCKYVYSAFPLGKLGEKKGFQPVTRQDLEALS